MSRQTDPRIASLILAALGSARTVVNVGAGAGSYEPNDRAVIAVEPSEAMVAQRPPPRARVVRAVAGALPLADGSVAASMATVTIHQWPDPLAGLAEMRRVTRGPVVVLTFDPDALDALWLVEYSPELYAAESRRYPTIASVTDALGPGTTSIPVPVPFDCRDGFTEAFYGRPRHSSIPPCAGRSRPGASSIREASPGRGGPRRRSRVRPLGPTPRCAAHPGPLHRLTAARDGTGGRRSPWPLSAPLHSCEPVWFSISTAPSSTPRTRSSVPGSSCGTTTVTSWNGRCGSATSVESTCSTRGEARTPPRSAPCSGAEGRPAPPT